VITADVGVACGVGIYSLYVGLGSGVFVSGGGANVGDGVRLGSIVLV
jgi:hypothetical protein